MRSVDLSSILKKIVRRVLQKKKIQVRFEKIDRNGIKPCKAINQRSLAGVIAPPPNPEKMSLIIYFAIVCSCTGAQMASPPLTCSLR